MISANRISIFTFSIRYLYDPNRIFLVYGNKAYISIFRPLMDKC